MKAHTSIFLMLMLFACNKSDENNHVSNTTTTSYFHTFITAYQKGDGYEAFSGDLYITINPTNHTWIYSPDLSDKLDEAKLAEYRELSEKNGDTSYNREFTYLVNPGRACWADNISKLDVICTNRAVDATHPVGTSLRDVMRVQLVSHAPYIRNNYTGVEEVFIDKLLSEVQEDELAMIKSLGLNFTKEVETKVTYQLEITLTTTDGESYTLPTHFRPLDPDKQY